MSGAANHWVAAPRERGAEPVREFGAMTDDLHGVGDWLLACGIHTVALESAGLTGFQCTKYWNGAAWRMAH